MTISLRGVAPLLLTAVLAPAAVGGQTLTGEAAVETRWFPESPLFASQRDVSISPSFFFEPELGLDWMDGNLRFDARAFLRVDGHDDRRTHGDLRELSLTLLTDRWTIMAGFGRVFWGVTEVNHLVDIVNQTDAVEDIDNEDKLGQPMVSVTRVGDLGALDVYWLPYFRERTFPDSRGRLRGPLPVTERAAYESDAEEWQQGFAARWSHVLGSVDFALSTFRGASREPLLLPAGGATEGTPPSAVRPFYATIDQTAVEVQWTRDATLWKLEAMTRGGHGDRFAALSAGVEYTLYQLFGGASDLGLLSEVMIDGRGRSAPPTLFDNDVFVGARWARNDVADTQVLGGVVVDYEHGDAFGLVEAERRLMEQWTVGLEARILANVEPGSFVDALRRDSFATLRISRFW